MPREQITPSSTSRILNGWALQPDPIGQVTPEGVLVESPILHVNWSKDGHDAATYAPGFVQLSMQVDSKHLKEVADRMEPDVVAYWFYTESLSRKALNDMIRQLRKARDGAFGSDE